MSTIDMARVPGMAYDIQAICAHFGEGLGAVPVAAAAVAAKAAQIARESGPSPLTVPTDPAKVAAHVKRLAADRLAQREAAAVAAEVADAAEREAMRLALEQTPKALVLVRDSFAKAAAEFSALVATAPHEVTATTTADGFADHARLLGAVDTMSIAAGFRRRLAEILGEDVRGEAALWLLLDLEPTASCGEVRQALADHAQALPATLEDWLRIVDLGASIAGPGEAADRAARFGAALYAAGMNSEDGGMLDRTYAEALQFSQAAS
jgi:hypothetical protein